MNKLLKTPHEEQTSANEEQIAIGFTDASLAGSTMTGGLITIPVVATAFSVDGDTSIVAVDIYVSTPGHDDSDLVDYSTSTPDRFGPISLYGKSFGGTLLSSISAVVAAGGAYGSVSVDGATDEHGGAAPGSPVFMANKPIPDDGLPHVVSGSINGNLYDTFIPRTVSTMRHYALLSIEDTPTYFVQVAANTDVSVTNTTPVQKVGATGPFLPTPITNARCAFGFQINYATESGMMGVFLFYDSADECWKISYSMNFILDPGDVEIVNPASAASLTGLVLLNTGTVSVFGLSLDYEVWGASSYVAGAAWTTVELGGYGGVSQGSTLALSAECTKWTY